MRKQVQLYRAAAINAIEASVRESRLASEQIVSSEEHRFRAHRAWQEFELWKSRNPAWAPAADALYADELVAWDNDRGRHD